MSERPTGWSAPRGEDRLVKLPYQGKCEVCLGALPAGVSAWYDASRKKVRCESCHNGPGSSDGSTRLPPTGTISTSVGTAGQSAAREYERRSRQHSQKVSEAIARDTAWRQQVKKEHPVIGRLVAAVTERPTAGPEPRHIAAWKTGAHGEQRVGAHLDNWAQAMNGRVLHDRRIPGTKANIDHIALSSTAVWVIDTKEYRGLVTASGGGIFSEPDLRVAGRVKTHLADGVNSQMKRVAGALDAAAKGSRRPPVYGVLCFVGADWPLIGGTFTVRGITVAWPDATIKLLTRSGRSEQTARLDHYTGILAKAFPAA